MNNKIVKYIKTLSVNKKSAELLTITVGNILLKQDNFENYIKNNEEKINHIRDWIASIIENNEQWKSPRVLTLDALNNAADKYFEKQNNKIKTIELDENHEKLIADLGDYYIVQMLTPEALDNESKVMQHCIGHGYYDYRLLNNTGYKYLSLRDKFNKAHATLELYKNKIVQLQGKQNNVPEQKYLNILVNYLFYDKNLNIEIDLRDYGLYFDEKNSSIYKIEEISLKENEDYLVVEFGENQKVMIQNSKKFNDYYQFRFDINNRYWAGKDYSLDMWTSYKESKFCICLENDNISYFMFFDENKKNCGGYIIENEKRIKYERKDLGLILLEQLNYIDSLGYILDKSQLNRYGLYYNEYDSKIYSIYKDNFPKNISLKGDAFKLNTFMGLNLESIYIDGSLRITTNNSGLEELKDVSITVKENLSYENIELNEIPTNIVSEKNISFAGSNIEKIPDNYVVNGNLDISRCRKIKNLPNGLVVNGDFSIRCLDIEELPKDIHVGKSLNLCFSKIKYLSDSFKNIDGNLDVSDCPNLKKLPVELNVSENILLSNTKNMVMPEKLKAKNVIITNSEIIKFSKDVEIENTLNIRNSLNIKELPDNLKCKILKINNNQEHLLKSTMDIEKIYIYDIIKNKKIIKNPSRILSIKEYFDINENNDLNIL